MRKKECNRILAYNKLLRVTAWLNMCFNSYKIVPSNQIFGILTSEEMIKTEDVILKIRQKESFARHKDKCLNVLQCFMHANEILKVKNRILMKEDASRF